MSQRDTLVHLFAGGCGGTVGAILTCPLEVVKTRLQSSHVTFYISEVQLSTVNGASVARMAPPGPLHCLKLILEKEGPRSLFRGLGPNLVGVAPSRYDLPCCAVICPVVASASIFLSFCVGYFMKFFPGFRCKGVWLGNLDLFCIWFSII
ncbi:unnamed protein product [Oncorhynchus mykiss]|uniref:Uncharacterized protein n=1 Tax=Oncorhynchus mykiss TaxID=8022 RepID=A0A060YEB6_ONCMY|nr:unnamed protein product [Oncorhynchus mykiss]